MKLEERILARRLAMPFQLVLSSCAQVLANKWAKEKEKQKKKPRGTGLRRGFSESQSPIGGRGSISTA
jgi:hypothetical protein